MPYPPASPVDMLFPAAGLDNSLPARQQPQMTTYAMLNVRAFPPSSDRLGGGSREGHSRVFEDQAGSDEARRITGLNVLTEATSITDPESFALVPITETWSAVATGDPTDLGGAWHPINNTGSNDGPDYSNEFSRDAGSRLLLDSGADGDFISVLSSYFVDQPTGVTVVVNGRRDCSTASSGYGLSADRPNNIGPMVAVSNTGLSGIIAYLQATGTNEVQAKIFSFTANSLTELASGTTQTLDGTSTLSDYTITLTNDAGNLEARFTASGVLNGGGDLDVTLTATTLLSGRRGGFGCQPRSSGSTFTNRVAAKSVSLTQLQPPGDVVRSSVDPSVPNPIDANQYYLPTDWRGVARANDGTLTVSAAGPTASVGPDFPAIDDTNDYIEFRMPNGGDGDIDSVMRWALYTGNVADQPGLSVIIDPAQFDGPEDIGSPVFRASSDGRNCLLIRIAVVRQTTTNMLKQPFATNAVGRAWAIIDNVVTDLGAFGPNLSSVESVFVWHQENRLRFTDDGTDIRFYVNGILVYSFNPSTLAAWTPAIGAALSQYTGIGFTGGYERTGTGTSQARFGTVRVVQGETISEPTFSNVKNKLAIFSPTLIEIGDTAELTIVDVAGLPLRQPLPQAASFNRKFYAVDGERELIIDPATNISSDWNGAVTDGTLPADTRLIAFFRGAAYLAATNSDPTIWFKSRTLDPLDWDFAADPQVSTAVAGNNGEVGQPADAITALIPYSDDYMVFGMSRSIGVLSGDPNYNGQFDTVSNETGIVGPRAYCFDDRGNLYFVGAGGLYRMFRGEFGPQPVGPRKLRRILEELDTSTNLIQMEFRASDRTVRIYITPTDGIELATVIVFDTRTEGFFRDQLPLTHGPWAIEQITGVKDIDRNLIIGGDDGYIRRPDDEATSDDGTAIESYVEIPVPEQAGGLLEFIAQELQFVLAEGGGTITWRWFSGASPEEVRLQQVGEEQESGTITGTGFKEPVGIRATGAAHKIRLEATSTTERWALERITAMVAPTGRRR